MTKSGVRCGPRRPVSVAAAVLAFVGGFLAAPAFALNADFPICGGEERVTCVVDGDTVWFEGTKYRFLDIDTPEKDALAECMAEGLLARQATARLAELLSAGPFAIEEEGKDRYGRTLARFRIGGRTAGEILIEEGLARPWSGKREDWCK